MTYKDFPVYIGYGNTEFISDWGYYRKFMLFADSVSVTNSTSSTPNRRLGSDVDRDDQFSYTADSVSNISLSFNFYSKPQENVEGENVYGFLMDNSEYKGNLIGNGTGSHFFPIRIGGNIYNKCYIQDYSISVAAFSPVKGTVNFRCFDPPQNEATQSDRGVNFEEYNDTMSGRSLITANTCDLVGVYNDVVSADIVPKISFSKRYSRTPIYTLGSVKPTDFLIDAVESQLQMESTGLSDFASYSGIKLEDTIALDIKDIDGNEILPNYFGGFELACHSGAKVNTYNYSVAGGDSIKTNATISEIII